MKYIIIVFIIITVFTFESCIDDKPTIIEIIDEIPDDPDDPDVPDDQDDQDDPPVIGIDAYNDLKTYIDRTVSPNFKLGSGVLLNDYVAKGKIYDLLTANFDQITLGNEMKQDAVVQADGSLKLDNIRNLIQVANDAGVSIYGHVLVWHSQQRASYLNSLIVPSLVVGAEGTPLDPSVITNSDFEVNTTGWNSWGNNSTRGRTEAGGGYLGGYAIWFTNPSVAGNAWNAQVAYDFTDALTVGAKYILNLHIKATKAGSISAGMQNPDNYAGAGTFGPINITTEWKEVTLEATITAANAKRFLFDCGTLDGTIYFDNVTISRMNPNKTDATRFVQLTEKTKAQKEEIITSEMERWIKGILEVTQVVKEWDVVNEPMDDGRPTELKTGVGRDLNDNEFYWQDYMGKDFAVKAIQFARKYGPSDIKLFINDYNLEYSMSKCRGLIEYVKYVESKGVKLDGIGTQMHINTGTNKDNIVQMFTLLAATGKLIKITELDLGLRDTNGNVVTTANATMENYMEQSDMYRFVIDKYFELIPAAQRYGITLWSPFDSPDTQGAWRRNEPIGLWTRDFQRKQAYAGFANGIAGRDLSIDKK